MAVDPLASKYPSLSPYNYVANNPPNNFDPDGRAIFRAGKEILPAQAQKLTYNVIYNALSGKEAYIDFFGRAHAFKDFCRLTKTYGFFEATWRTISGGSDPLYGFNPSTLYLDETINVNTASGESSFPTIQVETTYAMDDIASFGENQILGTNSSGEDVLGLNFNNEDGEMVIRLTESASSLNKVLGKYGYQLVKYLAGIKKVEGKKDQPYFVYRLEKAEEDINKQD